MDYLHQIRAEKCFMYYTHGMYPCADVYWIPDIFEAGLQILRSFKSLSKTCVFGEKLDVKFRKQSFQRDVSEIPSFLNQFHVHRRPLLTVAHTKQENSWIMSAIW